MGKDTFDLAPKHLRWNPLNTNESEDEQILNLRLPINLKDTFDLAPKHLRWNPSHTNESNGEKSCDTEYVPVPEVTLAPVRSNNRYDESPNDEYDYIQNEFLKHL